MSRRPAEATLMLLFYRHIKQEDTGAKCNVQGDAGPRACTAYGQPAPRHVLMATR
jgi:hypothetical protein